LIGPDSNRRYLSSPIFIIARPSTRGRSWYETTRLSSSRHKYTRKLLSTSFQLSPQRNFNLSKHIYSFKLLDVYDSGCTLAWGFIHVRSLLPVPVMTYSTVFIELAPLASLPNYQNLLIDDHTLDVKDNCYFEF